MAIKISETFLLPFNGKKDIRLTIDKNFEKVTIMDHETTPRASIDLDVEQLEEVLELVNESGIFKKKLKLDL